MILRKFVKPVCVLILIGFPLVGCYYLPEQAGTNPIPSADTSMIQTTSIDLPLSSTALAARYKFPDEINLEKRYLFYLHGKIIEEQGIPAISPDYGEYEYKEILETIESHGFSVISEQRPKDTDGYEYAMKVENQIRVLLMGGVPEHYITVVGASKGAAIAIYVSNFLRKSDVNFVLLGDCHPDVVEGFKRELVVLTGNVLSIYDSNDEYAGSCQELFTFSEGKGISRYYEIVLGIGTGHGILYQPLNEWIIPMVDWAMKDAP